MALKLRLRRRWKGVRCEPRCSHYATEKACTSRSQRRGRINAPSSRMQSHTKRLFGHIKRFKILAATNLICVSTLPNQPPRSRTKLRGSLIGEIGNLVSFDRKTKREVGAHVKTPRQAGGGCRSRGDRGNHGGGGRGADTLV